MAIEKYDHHGATVSVQSELKGKHREHCLCYRNCIHFKPCTPENCIVAEMLYSLCRIHNMVTPVWECKKYEAKDGDETRQY